MNNAEKTIERITNWLNDYCSQANANGFVIGISGGIDSAVTSTLCAMTGKKVIILTLPIRQTKLEFDRAEEHVAWLKSNFSNVISKQIDLSNVFSAFENELEVDCTNHHLAMANSRARLRMTTLYTVGQVNGLLVAGTGNKVEDFGIGFYTKYGDGGVDVSPIADLMKTEVYHLGKQLQLVESIQNASPTDGLWEDGRTDEDQIGASYPELEWAMTFTGDKELLNQRQLEVLSIFGRLNKMNQHKMLPIPVCEIPQSMRPIIE